MKKKVVVTREVFDETLAYLGRHFEVRSNQADIRFVGDELARRMQGMDAAVVTTSERIDAAIVAQCPSLEAICTASVGYNHIDVEACTRHGVMVTNTPGVLTESVADMAVCLTLATLRRVTEGERLVRSGNWQGTHLKQLLGHDLHHSTVGIAGFGRIGQALARRLRAFDVNLLYHARTPVEPDTEEGARYVSKDDLLRRSDIVILILPYTAETHHFMGRDELAKMKLSAVLINMARGGIVDDAALAEALKTRRLWAAGLDVYENEPKLNPALLELDNVVLTPHIGSATEPTRQEMAMTAARNCVAALTTGEPPNLVNPQVKQSGTGRRGTRAGIEA
ncbi:MAG TPA: D-glycerate dehydrogenase [Burkholderiales bacterium]|nr:D-glycerate dehydrogenase [Burkholderiales bacterium]